MDPPNAKGERKKDERKEYLKLKTRAERDQWLKDKGLWDKFYQYPEHIRQKIADGAVQPGWDKHMVYMSWAGPSSVSEWRGVRLTALSVNYCFEVRTTAPIRSGSETARTPMRRRSSTSASSSSTMTRSQSSVERFPPSGRPYSGDGAADPDRERDG